MTTLIPIRICWGGRWWVCGFKGQTQHQQYMCPLYCDGKFVPPDQFYNNNRSSNVVTVASWSPLISGWISVRAASACVDDEKKPGWTREIRPVLIRSFLNRLELQQLWNNYPGKLSNLANGSFCTGWWVQKSLLLQLDQSSLPLDNSQATWKCKQNWNWKYENSKLFQILWCCTSVMSANGLTIPRH